MRRGGRADLDPVGSFQQEAWKQRNAKICKPPSPRIFLTFAWGVGLKVKSLGLNVHGT